MLELGVVDIDEEDAVALGEEAAGEATTYAAGCAGDEIVHMGYFTGTIAIVNWEVCEG